MYNFQYANPTRVCFGEGQIATLPELIPAGSRLIGQYRSGLAAGQSRAASESSEGSGASGRAMGSRSVGGTQ